MKNAHVLIYQHNLIQTWSICWHFCLKLYNNTNVIFSSFLCPTGPTPLGLMLNNILDLR